LLFALWLQPSTALLASQIKTINSVHQLTKTTTQTLNQQRLMCQTSITEIPAFTYALYLLAQFREKRAADK
jgi:hypothetical protein